MQLLSGDGPAAVARVAEAVGIAHYQAQRSPQDKLLALQALQPKTTAVGMVGDGLNDGPVLAGADVSFAFGRAVPIGRARSDFVVLGSGSARSCKPWHLPAKHCASCARTWAGPWLTTLFLYQFAALGMVPPWLAVYGDGRPAHCGW